MQSVLASFVSLSISRGRPARAARLLGAVEAVSDNTGVRLQPITQTDLDRDAAPLRPQLGDEAFNALRAEGRAMTVEQAIEYALGEGDD